jgi:hypothetical protein
LDKTYEECPRRDVKIIIGDLNAKISKEDIYRPTTGKYSELLSLTTMGSD